MSAFAVWFMDPRGVWIYFLNAQKRLAGWEPAERMIARKAPHKIAPWQFYHEPGDLSWPGPAVALGGGGGDGAP